MYKKLVLAVFAALALCAGARTVVVDGDDRSPLIAASVFDANGTLVALTDTCGAFSARLPVAVRCMGYEAATLDHEADTLALAPASYGLPEMTFNLANRDVLRLICYVGALREQRHHGALLRVHGRLHAPRQKAEGLQG